MLYISRYIGADKYGVVDTDDYVETPCKYSELEDIVLKKHIAIEGVIVEPPNQWDSPWISDIVPYQNPAYVNPSVTRLKVMAGIDMRFSGKCLVYLSVPDSLYVDSLVLRLSDYCKYCCSGVLHKASLSNGQNLTLVLDDRLKVSATAFYNFWSTTGVHIDIREVKRKETLEAVYFPFHLFCLNDQIIDYEDRRLFYIALMLLRGDQLANEPFFEFDKIVKDKVGVSRRITDVYRDKFIELTSRKLVSKSDYMKRFWGDTIKDGYTVTKFYDAWKHGDSSTFDLAIESLPCIKDYLTHATKCNKQSIDFYLRYVKYFILPDDMKKLYCDFCARVIEFARASILEDN